MSSGGQAVGGVLGAVAGFLIAGPGGGLKGALYGAQIGIAIGGYLDPPKGPHTEGPRLSDLKYQTALYGAPIPRVYGTVALTGNVFWLENNQLKESSHTESQSGGKGGGGSKSTNTTYSYSATFAIGLCEGPIAGVRRIWVGPNLIYDSGSSDPTAVMASNQAATGFTVHIGSDTQLPDARMQATLGAANTPAYRGLAYIVFNDFALAPYSNSLAGAQVKVEVVKFGGSAFGYLRGASVPSLEPITGNTYYASASYYGDGEYLIFVPQFKYSGPIYPISYKGYRVLSDGSQQYLGVLSTGWGTGTATICPGKLDVPGFAVVVATGARLILMTINGEKATFLNDQGWFGAARVAKSGDDFYAEFPGAGYKIARWSYAQGFGGGATFLAKSAVQSSSCDQLEVFGDVLYRIGSGFLTKFDKTSLIFLSQIALPTGTYWSLDVHADNDIYVHEGAGGRTYHWDGASWTNTGMLTPHWYTTDKTFQFKDGVLTVSLSNYVFFYGTTTSIQTISLASIVQAECLASKLLTLGDIDTTELTQAVRGYRVSAVAALRSALEPLQGAWPFDVVQHGYTVKFKVRGSSSIATIAATELDARAVGEASGVSITNSREMDLILPARVRITYLDPDREYDSGEQYAERLNTAATNIQSIEMPIVLTSAEAAAIVERLLYLYWMERYDIIFVLPPTRQAIEPSDVITVDAEEATYNLRLTEITYEQDGRLTCKAKYNSAATYVTAALGETPVTTAATLTTAGDPNTIFLDIPAILSAANQPGFPVAMGGYLSGWQGGSLYESIDAGATWSSVQGFAGPGPIIGTANNAVATSLSFGLVDKKNIIVASFPNEAPYSATELAVMNGANYFAFGKHGRWEIIGVQNADIQVDGTYYLTDLHRGRFGTEWAASVHESGDLLVQLDPNLIPFITADVNDINAAGLYRSVSLGKTVDSASNQVFTYTAVNLKPLNPVYLNGNRHPTTNDWTLTWIPRTRVGGEWRDLVDATMAEASELYDVEIYSSGSYTTLKRTFSSLTSATTPYTSAQQIADFTVVQSTLYVKVYQISAVVGRGYALTTSITR